MPAVNLHLGRATASSDATLLLETALFAAPAGQIVQEQTSAGFTMEPYVAVQGIPELDDGVGAFLASKAGCSASPTLFSGDTNTSTLTLDLGADAIRWVPRSQDIVTGTRWYPTSGTSGPNIGFGGTVKPKLDAAYNYQGQYRRLPKPAIDFSEGGYGYLHVNNMPAATICLVAVLHPGDLDYYGLLEANVATTGEPFVLRYHHGQMRVYQDEKLVVQYESETSVQEPTIVMVSLDTTTDTGRFVCVDRSRATRTFNIASMTQVGFTGALGALGQGTAGNPFRYFADMNLLEVDLWPRALNTEQMLEVASKLAMVYGVPG